MNISIFGLGYVGCVSLGCLAQIGHRVIGVDINALKVEQINAGKPTIIEKDIADIIEEQHKKERIKATMDAKGAVLNSDCSIIAVGTPSSKNGHLNLEYIFKVAKDLGEVIRDKEDFHIIAIRSTILPGTCNKIADIIENASEKKRNSDFAIVANPEFLREGSAVYDYYHPPLTLIGSDHSQSARRVAELYDTLPGEIVITELKVAEIMKYVNNTYHALKISFANEVGNICKALGIDSHEVMEIFCKDKQLNISPYYFKPGFAYGGSCLPKDLKGLQTLAHDNYVKVPVIDSIDKTNEIQLLRAVDHLDQYKGQNLGFLGLSFKAGTDDLRNSPSVTLIETLLGKGHNISIFDHNVRVAKLTGTNKEYIESRIPHLANLLLESKEELITNCDVIIVATKEEEFNEILINLPDNKKIIDLVHINEQKIVNDNYYGINW